MQTRIAIEQIQQAKIMHEGKTRILKLVEVNESGRHKSVELR